MHLLSEPASGTGSRFGRIIIILSGIAALSASLITVVYVYWSLKY